MRRIIAPILLLLPALLVGCNPPANLAGAGTAPPRVLTQKEVNERHAANFLSAAKDFHREGQHEHAIRTLKELLEQFPDSDAAEEAAQLLAELEEASVGESADETERPK